jgi:diacylglycerol kinase (ATP)
MEQKAIVETLNELGFTTELYLVTPNSRISLVAADAVARGIPYIVVSGGDNTVGRAARGIVCSDSTLVIVPTGTRNNIAHALQLPVDVAAATRMIVQGERTRVDTGRLDLPGQNTHFVELLTVGLTAALFTAWDETLKGDVSRLAEVLGTLITHPPATFHLNLDNGRQKISVEAQTLLVLNIPYVGSNLQLDPSVSHQDGLLDVFLFANLGKLELMSYALQVAQGAPQDPRVRHLRVKQLELTTDPPLAVMLDGNVLAPSLFRRRTLRLECAPRVLNVMAGPISPK